MFNRRDREQAELSGYANSGNYLENLVVRDFVFLYWAEGGKPSPKNGRGDLFVGNTDAGIIRRIMKGAEEMGLENPTFRLILNNGRDVETEKVEWSKLLGIDSTKIKATIKKKGTEPKSYDSKRCVMKVTYPKSAVVLHVVMGIIRKLRES